MDENVKKMEIIVTKPTSSWRDKEIYLGNCVKISCVWLIAINQLATLINILNHIQLLELHTYGQNCLKNERYLNGMH